MDIMVFTREKQTRLVQYSGPCDHKLQNILYAKHFLWVYRCTVATQIQLMVVQHFSVETDFHM